MSTQNSSINLVQITDPHLFADSSGSLLGMNTKDSFNAVISEIIKHSKSFDAVLVTGDISQDRSVGSYQNFIAQVSQLQKKCYCILGNHDQYEALQSALIKADNNYVCYQQHLLLADNWQIIFLNSQVMGQSYGYLAHDQLDILKKQLAAYPNKYALIVLHHNPIASNSAWLDEHNLRNANELWQILKSFNNVKGVLCGHIHQKVDVCHYNIQVMATPSTCFQFKPNSEKFTLDTQMAGWREIELTTTGEIVSSVYRLDHKKNNLDLLSQGY